MKIVAETVCGGLKVETDLCDNVLFLIAGPESNQMNQVGLSYFRIIYLFIYSNIDQGLAQTNLQTNHYINTSTLELQ